MLKQINVHHKESFLYDVCPSCDVSTSSSCLTLYRIWISFGGAQFLFRIQVIIAEEHKNHRHINNESKKLKNALMLN